MLIGVILAAGKGKRFKSSTPKVLHLLYDNPILEYVLDSFNELKIKKIIVVIGAHYKKVSKYLDNYSQKTNKKLEIANQNRQLGSGHALKLALNKIKDSYASSSKVNLLIINGDMPLISTFSLNEVVQTHKKSNADLTFLTALQVNPYGYGRVIRKLQENSINVIKITEEKDCTHEERKINEVNCGIYCIKLTKLKTWIKKLKNINKQKEYYITDLVEIAAKESSKINTHTTSDLDEIHGVNTRADLEKAFYIMNQKILKKYQDKGITILDPRNTYIGPNVKIAKDNTIYPNTFLKGKIKIGKGNNLGPNLYIEGQVTIGNNNEITYSHITNSKIGNNNLIGPYSRLRDNTIIGNNIKVGNFVEIKNSKVSDHTQIAHLSYIGDTTIGKKVNIGAGTITANYNSITGKKSKTVIKDHASTGSNSVLVAPVVINEGALVAAGSVVTKNVPKYALAITRPKQENKTGWVKKRG